MSCVSWTSAPWLASWWTSVSSSTTALFVHVPRLSLGLLSPWRRPSQFYSRVLMSQITLTSIASSALPSATTSHICTVTWVMNAHMCITNSENCSIHLHQHLCSCWIMRLRLSLQWVMPMCQPRGLLHLQFLWTNPLFIRCSFNQSSDFPSTHYHLLPAWNHHWWGCCWAHLQWWELAGCSSQKGIHVRWRGGILSTCIYEVQTIIPNV